MAKLNKQNVKAKKAITRTVLVPADEADAKRLDEAKATATRSRLIGDKDQVEEAEAKHLEVLAEVREAGLEFVFKGIGRKGYEAVLREHPATTEQLAKAEADGVGKPQWNVDTFPAALCHASSADSDLSAEDWVNDIFESPEWGPGELGALFNAALDANSDRRVVELGN